MECATGVSKVQFVMGQPGDSGFVSRVASDSVAQAMNTLILAGRNWILITSCDYPFGDRVRAAIGGEYLRRQFIPPTDCA